MTLGVAARRLALPVLAAAAAAGWALALRGYPPLLAGLAGLAVGALVWVAQGTLRQLLGMYRR